ncbi:hypothetical protein LNQ52_22890 [Klebsiella pneumoniae subsp. pneumoniae]|nr:hypothetical protein [Klebsiella pneumoniae subsp. pneumoniae]
MSAFSGAAVAAAGPYHRLAVIGLMMALWVLIFAPAGGSSYSHPSPRLLARPARPDPQPVGDGA